MCILTQGYQPTILDLIKMNVTCPHFHSSFQVKISFLVPFTKKYPDKIGLQRKANLALNLQ